jgi:hypothetical protein
MDEAHRGRKRKAEDLRRSLPVMAAKTMDANAKSKLVEGIVRSAPRFIFSANEDPKYAEFLSKEPWTLRMQLG